MTEDDVLAMLGRAGDAPSIVLDGHDLRSPTIREAARIAVERGWLDPGDLVRGDQWSWFEARITPAGRVAIAEAMVRDAYHDERWPVRRCDRCGRPYTGPAVYCSRVCAVADA